MKLTETVISILTGLMTGVIIIVSVMNLLTSNIFAGIVGLAISGLIT